LWLARRVLKESFLLVESDLIFEASLLKGLLEPDKIAVSHILPWMNGTTITMGSSGEAASFNKVTTSPTLQKDQNTPMHNSAYKTVNICSLSRATWSRALPRLEQAIVDGRVNEYYEVVFAEMVADGSLSFECVLFDSDQWYEVDKIEDLPGAVRIARRINKPTKPLISTVRKAAGPRHELEQAGGTRLNTIQR
jgi:choline kinase